MATCKECLHYELCQHNTYKEAQFLGKDKEVYITIKNRISCRFFTPKSDYVKRGEWIIETYKTSDAKYMRCSNCKSVIDLKLNTAIDENEFDFCPYCSADMRKEDNNER